MTNKHYGMNFLYVLITLFLLIMGVSVSYAENDNRGFYLGASAGWADQKDACDDAFGSCDDDDFAWKVFGGYKFNQYFGIEGGSVDFGQSEGDALFIDLSNLQIFQATQEVKIDGFFLSGLVAWPVSDNFSVLAKLGLIYWDIEFDIADSDNFALVGDEDENGTDVFFGLGGQYNITDNFSVRAEWERFNNIGESEIGTTDIDLISGGIVLQF